MWFLSFHLSPKPQRGLQETDWGVNKKGLPFPILQLSPSDSAKLCGSATYCNLWILVVQLMHLLYLLQFFFRQMLWIWSVRSSLERILPARCWTAPWVPWRRLWRSFWSRRSSTRRATVTWNQLGLAPQKVWCLERRTTDQWIMMNYSPLSYPRIHVLTSLSISLSHAGCYSQPYSWNWLHSWHDTLKQIMSPWFPQFGHFQFHLCKFHLISSKFQIPLFQRRWRNHEETIQESSKPSPEAVLLLPRLARLGLVAEEVALLLDQLEQLAQRVGRSSAMAATRNPASASALVTNHLTKIGMKLRNKQHVRYENI